MSTETEHMLAHKVKLKNVPMGMTFYTNYHDFEYNLESGEKIMTEPVNGKQCIMFVGYGMTSIEAKTTPLDPESDCWVHEPSKCKTLRDRVLAHLKSELESANVFGDDDKPIAFERISEYSFGGFVNFQLKDKNHQYHENGHPVWHLIADLFNIIP